MVQGTCLVVTKLRDVIPSHASQPVETVDGPHGQNHETLKPFWQVLFNPPKEVRRRCVCASFLHISQPEFSLKNRNQTRPLELSSQASVIPIRSSFPMKHILCQFLPQKPQHFHYKSITIVRPSRQEIHHNNFTGKRKGGQPTFDPKNLSCTHSESKYALEA